MRVELTTEGGFATFPGLAKPIVLDAAELSADDNMELEKLAAAARDENLPYQSSRAAPVPDGRRYRISIRHENASYVLEAADPMVPPAFGALMDFVKKNGRR